MKFLHEMYDHALETKYKLYQVNARELSDRLKQSYQLPQETLQTFNSDTALGKNIIRVKQLKAEGYDIREDDARVRDIEKMKEKIQKNEHVKPMTKQGIHFGYELMPIAVSVKGAFEQHETPLELVDGFKRMFCMDIVPDIEILVKVYDELDDREWINAMILYNSWKFVDGESAEKYMDRGFQLGLYHRYNMMFIDMVVPRESLFKSCDIYTVGGDLRQYQYEKGSTTRIYQTFWNNAYFHDDIQAIYDILMVAPIFQLKKKGIMEEYNPKESQYRYGGLGRILEIFISILGEIRRYEFNQNIMDRKRFNRAILTDYFAEPTLQKHFVKIITMTVDGHIVNYIKTHMREDLKKRVVEGMGYEYQPPEQKIYRNETPFDINDIKL